ncbi:hypothetical protein C3F09_02055 [candidate division GN15 bacterium]|uniref:6-bladed beta-propeller n=1 Tax=candidate division GN15 bacterium TaxID=2072418 RepID=A0A855XBJ6_9BACT|nr:MAG: hypothetical protein C3F09_02055 [candidate division GN15 bacterium]
MKVALFALLLLPALALGQGAALRLSPDVATFTAMTYDNGADGPLRNPGFAFFDRRAGELFVAATGNRRIVVYDFNLTPKFSFKHFVWDPKAKKQVLGEPKAVVVNSDGDMLVIDNMADYVDVLDFRGKSYQQVYPNRLLGDSTLKVRADLIAIDDRDNVYLSVVGDITAILALDRDLNLKRRLIERTADSTTSIVGPLAMAVLDSLILLTEFRDTPVLKLFDTAGQYLRGFGGREIAKEDFSMPIAAAIYRDSTGTVSFLVADALRQVIKWIGSDGSLLASFGGYGSYPGALSYPAGLTYAGNRTFFVTERVGARIQRFTVR